MTPFRTLLVALAAALVLASPSAALAGSLDKTCSGKNGDKLDSCLLKHFPAQRLVVETACATQPQGERFDCRKSGYELAGIKITEKTSDDKSSEKTDATAEEPAAETSSGKGSTSSGGSSAAATDAAAAGGKSGGGKGATSAEGGKASTAPAGGKAEPAGGKAEPAGDAAGGTAAGKAPAGGEAPPAGGEAPPADEKPKKDKSTGDAPATESGGKSGKSGGK